MIDLSFADIRARTDNDKAIGIIPLRFYRDGVLVTEDYPLLARDEEGIYGVHHVKVRHPESDVETWQPGFSVSLLPHPQTDPSVVGARVADTPHRRAADHALPLLVLHTPALALLTERNIGGRGVGRRGSYLETWRIYRDMSESLARVRATLLGPPPAPKDWHYTPLP